MKTGSLLLAIGVVLALPGCGGGGSTPPTPVTTLAPKAIIKVLIDPNPVLAEDSGLDDYPWDFRFNLQVSEGSGLVGFVVTSMQTTVASALSGALLISTDTNPFVGVRIAPGGQETRQFHSGPYRMENFSKEARVNVKMNFSDERGNPSVFDGSVNVQHVGEVHRLTE